MFYIVNAAKKIEPKIRKAQIPATILIIMDLEFLAVDFLLAIFLTPKKKNRWFITEYIII